MPLRLLLNHRDFLAVHKIEMLIIFLAVRLYVSCEYDKIYTNIISKRGEKMEHIRGRHMDKNNSIQLFEDRKIRTAWDEEQEEWYFSVVDVIAVLTDSSNPTDYLKKMRKRDEQLASYLGTNCPQVAMMGATGKKRKVLAATAEQLLRIIQSIPSPQAEPFKLWLAQVGSERIEETIDPEQAIDRALETYQKKGYDTDWIHQRLLSIRVRNELTTEWQERGVQQGKEYAILTDEITKAWSGMTTRQYDKSIGAVSRNEKK